MSHQPPVSLDSSSNDGGSTSADESISDKSSVSEEAERRPSEQEPIPSTETNKTKSISENRECKRATQKGNDTEMRGYLNKAYRDLLNSVIEDAAGLAHTKPNELYQSQIGASLWTSREKQAFFRALSTKGRDDLPGISRAVGTKNEVEVRSYLLLLSTFSSDIHSKSSTDTDSSSGNTPAAYEIGERCEVALELTADALCQHVLKDEIAAEKARFGNFWLINEETAAQIEVRHQQTELSAAGQVVDPEPNASGERNSIPKPDNHSTAEATEISDDEIKILEPGRNIISASFLQPESFLQLSRSIFMNNGINPELGWAHLGSMSDVSDTPAIFCSTLDDFYRIAINRTQWIVRATLFQAFSRLRAKDDQGPAEQVTVEDVKSAIDFLDIAFDWKRYWAGVARRCGVEVYSEAEKFRDGRPGTKVGRLLTFDEVEEELGFPRTAETTEIINGKGAEIDSEEPGSSDSELSSIGPSESEERSDDGAESEVGATGIAETKSGRRRAKRFSSDGDESNEDSNLNSLDEQASRKEEQQLLEMIRSSHYPPAKLQLSEANRSTFDRARKRVKLDPQSDWRDNVVYMAEWEQRRMSLEDTEREDREDE